MWIRTLLAVGHTALLPAPQLGPYGSQEQQGNILGGLHGGAPEELHAESKDSIWLSEPNIASLIALTTTQPTASSIMSFRIQKLRTASAEADLQDSAINSPWYTLSSSGGM